MKSNSTIPTPMTLIKLRIKGAMTCSVPATWRVAYSLPTPLVVLLTDTLPLSLLLPPSLSPPSLSLSFTPYIVSGTSSIKIQTTVRSSRSSSSSNKVTRSRPYFLPPLLFIFPSLIRQVQRCLFLPSIVLHDAY